MAKKLRYLNAQSRYDVILMCSLKTHIENMIKLWTSLDRSPLIIKWMKSAVLSVANARDEVFSELEEVEIERIVVMAENANFNLNYSNASISNAKPGEKLYNLEVTEQGQEKIVEALAQTNCLSCDGNNCKQCYIKDMFTTWDITPINEIVDAKCPCPYWIKGELK